MWLGTIGLTLKQGKDISRNNAQNVVNGSLNANGNTKKIKIKNNLKIIDKTIAHM